MDGWMDGWKTAYSVLVVVLHTFHSLNVACAPKRPRQGNKKKAKGVKRKDPQILADMYTNMYRRQIVRPKTH